MTNPSRRRSSSSSSSSAETAIHVPEEFEDVITREMVYDPVRLSESEDPKQHLFNRSTLEKIWEGSLCALNPFNRIPFNIANAVPQVELRKSIAVYLVNNSAALPANSMLHVLLIQEYSKPLSAIHMDYMLRKIQMFCHFLTDNDYEDPDDGLQAQEDSWKAIWRNINQLRLYCQYRQENLQLLKNNVQGLRSVFRIVDADIMKIYEANKCEEAKDVYRETLRLLNLMDVSWSDLQMVPNSHICNLSYVLADASEDYIRLQNMVMRAYRRIFYLRTGAKAPDSVRNCVSDCGCVITESVVQMLGREPKSNISNEDFLNALAVLSVCWAKDKNAVANCSKYSIILAESLAVLLSRAYETMARSIDDYADAAENDGNGRNILDKGVEMTLYLMYKLLISDDKAFSRHRHKILQTDVVQLFEWMVVMALSGLQIGCKSMRFALCCTAIAYRKMKRKRNMDYDRLQIFQQFLHDPVITNYGDRVKIAVTKLLRLDAPADVHI